MTVALGYAIVPTDSGAYWWHRLFLNANRIVFLGTRGNQSLRGVLTRLAGSVTSGTAPWIVAAVLVVIVGLAAAAVLYRAGHPVAGMLACALTGLLVSPLTWDHHWVWVAPGIALLAHLGARARGAARAAWWAAAGRPGAGVRRVAAVLGAVPVRADPGRAVLVRARNLLRAAATSRGTTSSTGTACSCWPATSSCWPGCAALAAAVRGRGPREAPAWTLSSRTLREGLAARVVAANRISSERVAAALRAVPRHLFLPGLPPEAAYRDEAIVTKRDAGRPADQLILPARHHGHHARPAGPGPGPAGARDRRRDRLQRRADQPHRRPRRAR